MLDPDRPGSCPEPPRRPLRRRGADLQSGGAAEEGFQIERWRKVGEFWPNPLKHPYIAAERRLPQL